MDHDTPPPHALAAYPWASIVDFAPPRGVGDEDCAHAEMLVTTEPFGGRMTRAHRAFFTPSPEELEKLNAGGTVVVTLIGDGIQPFACGVFDPAPAPDPPVPAPRPWHHQPAV